MKVIIESTDRIVEVVGFGRSMEFPARVWEGETESGVKVQLLVTRVAARNDQDQTQFERELLQEQKVASADAVEAFPLRLIL
jgi:hypothetical protein